MWDGKRVSVVLMTYAERESIRKVIEGFLGTGVVDEVLVVDNNAQSGTAEEMGRHRPGRSASRSRGTATPSAAVSLRRRAIWLCSQNPTAPFSPRTS